MKTETHLELAEQWQTALDKLDPTKDRLAVIEICMMMGTTLMNAVLHKRGIVDEPYDQNHTNRPALTPEFKAKITPDVQAMLDDLFFIEETRKLHCRGISPDREERDLPAWEPAAVTECLARLGNIKAFQANVFTE